MAVLVIVRTIVMVILWFNIFRVHAMGPPQLNTLYVEIGQLYPRADFAGVLIDLNVDQAIARGVSALNLTDRFLQHSYNKDKQIMGRWTGANRNFHFLSLKRRQVQHNLNILTTDLTEVTEQYRIPGSRQTHSTSKQPNSTPNPKPTNRRKRGINFDIEFDVNKALKTVVNGVVSIFSSPRSLDKIQKSVDKVAFRTSRLESKFANFTTHIDKIIHWMKVDFAEDVDEVHMIASINSALTIANDGILELLNSITPLVEGKLTHNLLDPLQSQSLIDKTQGLADRYGLQVIVDQPVDILKCSVTTFATNSSWYALLSIPLVFRTEAMAARQFINIPWIYKGQSVQWSFSDGIVATQPGLYPEIKNVFVPMNSLTKVCERFNNNFLCHKRINHFPTCQVSLLFNYTQQCALKLAAPKVRYSFGSFNFLFFQKPTDSLVQCPGKTFNAKYHGLINFEEISKCTITTPKFTLLPKSPESEQSTLVYKTKPLFVMDSEWLKMTIAFDKTNKKHSSHNEPNPWLAMESNNDEEVRIFGSYTILVNSIFMFILAIVVVFMLSLCIVNCVRYPPKFLQDHPFSFRQGSFTSVHCNEEDIPMNPASDEVGEKEDHPAIAEGGVLTLVRDRPVAT